MIPYLWRKEWVMPRVLSYRQLENSLIKRLGRMAAVAGGGLGRGLRAFGNFFVRRYTVVFVPHSEKKVYNFRVNILSIVCFFLVTGGIIGAFFWYGANYNDTRVALSTSSSQLQERQASLDKMRDEMGNLLLQARNFEAALSGVLSTIGPNSASVSGDSGSGDLNSFFSIRETPEGTLHEVDDMRRLASYLSGAIEPVREVGAALGANSVILSEIPSIWPVAGGVGRITMHFGNNRHPFGGQPYIHTGIDISTGRSGDAVVASADGIVHLVESDPSGYGNYVIIRHKHGYFTRYAHLLSARVRLGQRVQQGDVIGNIGNTGLSTGPHLHYEVIVGSDIVDPYQYMKIRSSWWGRR